MLEIKSMKARRDTWRSPEVNLTLRRGEIAAIIGLSGSGKTSILLSLIGLLPYDGVAEYGGVEIKLIDKTYLRSKIAYVPDEPESYLLNRRVFDEVAFGPENLGWHPRKIIESTIKALEIVGLLNLYDSEVSALSGGQKQRLVIADALSISPEIILLDNPFSNIDWEAKKTISKTLEQLCGEGISIILTGYSLEELHLKPDKTLFIGEFGEPYSNGDGNVSHHPSERTRKLLEVRDVSFSYDKIRNILRGVSFSANAGEIISIIGRNGVGKTTLLKILAGIYRPDKGIISINGVRPNSRLSTYVSQNPSAFLTETTPREELSMHRKIDMINFLEEIGLSYLLDRPIYTLSLGEKRVISILSGLSRGTLLLCLDEPTSGLDYKLRHVVGEMLRKATESGMMVITATHDISFAEAYSDKILLLEDGVIYDDWRRILDG
ncbi:MAG: ATP-binding cassette domain-containing protein [Nitrososphaerota archaeon]